VIGGRGVRANDSGSAISKAVGAHAARSMQALVSGALKPLLRRATTLMPPNPNGRRFCILHLDGLSRGTLVQAIEHGQMPFLARLLRGGSYRLSDCWSGAPASTPAFQAGLLYGIRDPDIPGFLWYDRARHQEVRMDRSADASRIESGLSGRGEALMRDGTTSFSIFAGGADVNALSMAGWSSDRVQLVPSGHDHWHLAAASVAHSLTAARVLGRLVSEGGAAIADFFRWSASVGRIQHEPTFLLHRVGLAIGAREAATWGTVLDLVRGVPALYVCFSDYDEIAHRRAPDNGVSLASLVGIDWALARIFAAGAAVAELNYDFYVLSDHGQVDTRPFEEVTGLSLLDYMALAVPADEGPPRVPEDVVRDIARFRKVDRATGALPSSLQHRAKEAMLEAARAIAFARGDSEWLRVLDEVVCIDAGDISHIYFGREPRPLEAGEIEKRYGRILKVLTGCPAIGIIAARGGRSGVAWYRGQRVDLADPAQTRELALGYGGLLVGEFLTKMVRIPSAGDLIVYGNGLPDGSNVAFAWEFGSHAGVGRDEVETFVIHPAHVAFDFSHVHHGADLHDFFVVRYLRGRPLAR
jgi:hypothetical protein